MMKPDITLLIESLKADSQAAFDPMENERDISIDRTMHGFQFRANWFASRNKKTFSTFLVPRFDGSFPVRALTIGVFEGMDSVWQMQNTLKHPDSELIGIDPWSADGMKQDEKEMLDVYMRAVHNLSPWKNARLLRGCSQDIMPYLEPEFDLIYVDGMHHAEPVYRDAVNALRLIKPGGWIMFDDVRNKRNYRDHVRHGIIKFLEEHGDQFDHAWSNRHCECIEKTS